MKTDTEEPIQRNQVDELKCDSIVVDVENDPSAPCPPPGTHDAPVAEIKLPRTDAALAFEPMEVTCEIIRQQKFFDVCKIASEEKFQKELIPPNINQKLLKRLKDVNLFPDKQNEWGKTLLLELPSDRPVWFIGDIHGDFDSLKSLAEFASCHDRKTFGDKTPTNLFFLGDFIDRGKCSAQVMAWILEEEVKTGRKKRFNIMAVAGNHDIGLFFDEGARQFKSRTSPCEFVDELNCKLNGKLSGDIYKSFGLKFIEVFANLPRMAIINKTLMAFHGGVPHTDMQSRIKTQEDINDEMALRDFVWARLHPSRLKRLPNRGSSGHELGIENFDTFIKILADPSILDFAPKVALRGHDHEKENFRAYDKYQNCKLITLNSFTDHDSGFCPPAILRWVPDEPMKFTLFRIDLRDNKLATQTCETDFPATIIVENASAASMQKDPIDKRVVEKTSTDSNPMAESCRNLAASITHADRRKCHNGAPNPNLRSVFRIRLLLAAISLMVGGILGALFGYLIGCRETEKSDHNPSTAKTEELDRYIYEFDRFFSGLKTENTTNTINESASTLQQNNASTEIKDSVANARAGNSEPKTSVNDSSETIKASPDSEADTPKH